MRPMTGVRLLVFRLVAASLVLQVAAAATPVAGQEDSEDSPYRAGLVATYTASGKSVSRTDEVVAFDWQDAACDRRLPTGPFEAVWRGRLWTKSVGSHRLHCYVQGDVRIELAGETVIQGTAQQPQWLTS